MIGERERHPSLPAHSPLIPGLDGTSNPVPLMICYSGQAATLTLPERM